jgi:hypothetical protein
VQHEEGSVPGLMHSTTSNVIFGDVSPAELFCNNNLSNCFMILFLQKAGISIFDENYGQSISKKYLSDLKVARKVEKLHFFSPMYSLSCIFGYQCLTSSITHLGIKSLL